MRACVGELAGHDLFFVLVLAAFSLPNGHHLDLGPHSCRLSAPCSRRCSSPCVLPLVRRGQSANGWACSLWTESTRWPTESRCLRTVETGTTTPNVLLRC